MNHSAWARPRGGGAGACLCMHVSAWAYVAVLMGLAVLLILAGVSMFGAVIEVNLLSFLTVQSASNAPLNLLLALAGFICLGNVSLNVPRRCLSPDAPGVV